MNAEAAYRALRPYFAAAAYFVSLQTGALAEQLELDDDALEEELTARIAKGEAYGWESMSPRALEHPWRAEMREELLDAIAYEAIRLRAEARAAA